MKRLIVIVCILLSFVGFSNAEVETDPVKRIYLQMDLDDIDAKLSNAKSSIDTLVALANQRTKIVKSLCGEISEEYANTLTFTASCYYHLKNYSKVYELEEKAISIWGSIYGEKSEEFALCLTNLALQHYYLDDFSTVIKLEKRSYKIYNCKSSQYLQSIRNIAHYNYSLKKYDDAINWGIKALNIAENDSTKHILTRNIARYHYHNKEYEKAIIYEIDAQSLAEKIYGTQHLQYGKSLYNLAVYNAANDEYDIAIDYAIKSLPYLETDLENPLDYMYALQTIYSTLFQIKNYNQAIFYAKKTLDLYYATNITDDELYKNILEHLAKSYKYKMQPDDALSYAESLLSFTEDNSYDRYRIVGLIASCYFDKQDYYNAVQWREYALSMFLEQVENQSNGFTDEDCSEYLAQGANIAMLYYKMGNYNLATDIFIKLYEYVDWINENKIDVSIEALYEFYTNYGGYLLELCEYESYVKLFEEMYVSIDETFYDYPRLLSNLAGGYSMIGDYKNAIKFGNESLKLKKEQGDSVGVSISLKALAGFYYEMGNIEQAIKFTQESAEIRESFIGKKDDAYASIMQNLCFFYSQNRNYDKILLPLKESYNITRSKIINHFVNMDSYSRILFWNKYSGLFYNHYIEMPYYSTDKKAIDIAYNSTLLGKGILLNTEIELARYIAESGNKEAEDLYNKLLTTRRWLNKLYERPISERRVDTDSLENVAETLERELIEKSKVYGDFTRNLTIDWEQVQSKLGDDDIAIEFVSFPTENDSMMYCALTLKNGYESPRMTPLFEAQNLAKIDRDGYYTTASIYNLVWKPLANEIGDAKNIYFSPTGELYNIAIESVPIAEKDKYVFDKWNLYRLSSTRELAVTKSEKNTPNVVLYGGLRYDADGVNFEKDTTWGTNYLTKTRVLPDSLGLRAQYGYLPGTLNEVTEINALYEKNSIPTLLYTDSIGTESTLKSLSGKHISNLHISTHGFYYSEEEIERKKNLKYLSLLQLDDTPRYIEDKSMTRSGLLFAGANAILKGDSIPEGCDDGILTAQEIASLDFRGLDLLVLSACQTGLGEIKGDGVFGLQRGFKKAGVQSIVMSLWEVDDDATQMLMTAFYENLLAGKSKRDSLLHAQDKVRKFVGEINGTMRDFSNPKYWAGFVILDALN